MYVHETAIKQLLEHENTLSPIQQEYLTKKCPHCGEGELHEVDGETEQYLWCNTCDLSMDSDGGYTC